jgi:hypothetical protein
MEPLLTVEVRGRPATFATAHESPWQQAIRDAILRSGVSPYVEGRSAVRMEFRTPAPRNANEDLGPR